MAQIDLNNIKSNSHKSKDGCEQRSQNDRPKLKPIVDKENVVSSKKSILKKIGKAFMGETKGTDVKTVFFYEYAIPWIKDSAFSLLESIFYKGSRHRGYQSFFNSYNQPNYSFSSFYNGRQYNNYSNPSYMRPETQKPDPRNIIMASRADGQRVVDELYARIANYGNASLADLYDLIDQPSDFIDNDWGWKDPRDIGLKKVPRGWLIDVASPVYLGR